MQARAIPVRGARRPRSRPYVRTPFAAVILSLLAFLSPALTLAPINAGERMAGGPGTSRPAAGPRLPQLLDVDARTRPPILSRPMALPAAPPDIVDTSRWEVALETARASAGAYGVTFAAVRDGELLWAGSSGRARDGRIPLAPESPLVIGSVTKTFVAATVLQLVEEGQMQLTDSIRDHLPTLGSVSREVTIGQLLDHTSGLADLFNDTTRRGLEDHPGKAWEVADVLASLHAPWYKPGEGWAYANTNYFILGLLIEHLTGATLAAELERRFTDPLNLDATHILTGLETDAPLEPAWTSIFWASGAMRASAADLARWGDRLYDGDLLAPATRTAMLKVNDDDYGLGVQKIELTGPDGYGHTGLLNTYTTLLVHLPDANVTLAVLVNRSHVDLNGMLTVEPPGGGPSLMELAADG